MTDSMATRQGYANALTKLADNTNIVVLDADLSKSTKTAVFEALHPERFFNMGIAEQDMIGTAAGLALAGKTVFASTFAIFATGRAWEQIRNSVTLDNLNVKIVATHGGISVGPDGASHQALEDIAIMRALPNMQIIVPACGISAEKLIIAASKAPGSFYIRLGRSAVPNLTSPDAKLEIGKGIVLKEGKDVLIVACGLTVIEALNACSELEEKNISAGVIDMHTIKPLDIELLQNEAKKYKKIVTVEEHSIIGGLGSAVSEAIAESEDINIPVLRLGIDDQYGQSGEMDQLLEKYRINAKGITESILEWRRIPIEK